MDIAFLLGTKIIELTLIVLIGYGLVKSKLLKSEDSKTLSVIGNKKSPFQILSNHSRKTNKALHIKALFISS